MTIFQHFRVIKTDITFENPSIRGAGAKCGKKSTRHSICCSISLETAYIKIPVGIFCTDRDLVSYIKAFD